MIHFKDTKNKSALSTRWAQMTKQEQIIEKKKMEIQAKLEAQKQAAALAAQAKLANICNKDEKGKEKTNIFSNDGSFMNQFKALLEKQKQEKKVKEELELQKREEEERKAAEAKHKAALESNDGDEKCPENDYSNNEQEERSSGERSRERHRRWSDKDRGRNRQSSPITPVIEDRKKHSDKSIPSLMQIPIRPPGDTSPENGNRNPWPNYQHDDDDDDSSAEHDSGNRDSGPTGPPSMAINPWGPGPMPGSNMGPNMGMGPMGPNMGPGGPNMGPGGPNMGPGPMGPMMGPGGPNMPPMPPGGPMPPWGGPPNFPMPPNFMGPNGPGGPCGPMPPNMCGPNMRGPGPNGPMPPFCGPPFPNQFMGPNGPPNSMMPPNSNGNMPPFMGPRPPFGPNFGPNGPPNMPPFMPPNSMQMPNMSDNKPLDAIPPPEPMKLQNIPPPMPLTLNHIPKPKDMEPGGLSNTSQVLSPDALPPPVLRAAAEVANNGDHWENVLKAIHSQDQNMWFLHNPSSNEYKAFRDLVIKLRHEKKPEVKPEDKYEPEFCLDDDSNDSRPAIKEESKDSSYMDSYQPWQNQSNMSFKREHTSSQSDDESDSKRERKKKRKSRWGDDPPVADIKPPGVMAPLPGFSMPGIQLGKIDEDGVKLTTVNRNNQALMQYALTNYGTTNLNAEDWKKCEDNFKLNLLYQDMLKKRQQLEKLAAQGKHKYEYDSDEDTSEGTWEHRLRAKEMNATEKWADELTKQAAGKHHIGDFLPPEELRKFMEKYSAAKSGKEPDLSDYKEFKLKEDNVGFKMLQKLGWSEGQGLGAEGTGIVDPVNKANQPVANLGLGANTGEAVNPDDDEFDAYRKRMMLAYRFRPNPLNNPRRPYY